MLMDWQGPGPLAAQLGRGMGLVSWPGAWAWSAGLGHGPGQLGWDMGLGHGPGQLGWDMGLGHGPGQLGWDMGLVNWPEAWVGFVRPGADSSDKKGRDTVLWAQVLTATIWIAIADRSGWRAGCRCGQLQLPG